MNETKIKVGRITDASDDSELEQIRQVETIGGKPKPVFILLPPGYCTNIPLDSTVLMVSGDGQSEFGIPGKPEARFGNLKLMEVKIGNVQTRANVFFCEDGNIYINPNGTEKATDWAVQYSALKAELDEMKAKVNSLVTAHNTHVHPGVTSGGASTRVTTTTASQSTADFSKAKSEKVRLP